MNEPYVLLLHDLVRAYKTNAGVLQVLSGASLALNQGEFVGLIGPSGSGKSSLLHAAGLLEKPQGGSIQIDGVECVGMSDAERTAVRRDKLGFVYQFHNLLPEFSALDNAAMPLTVSGGSLKAARLAAEELLVGLGLGERLHHQPAQLSGGEQQRVAIARALVNKPRLVLADEPTGNLDPATSRAVFAALRQFARDRGAAVLVATHNHELAGQMDRVMGLVDGHVVETGRPTLH